MVPKKFVIDTTVVIAVVVNEPHKPALVEHTRGADLLAPTSLAAEVGNAFSAMFKRDRMTLADAQKALEGFRQIPLRLVALDLDHALQLSHDLSIYAYDAYVLACALQHDVPLLTLDGGQKEAARRAGLEILEITS